MRPYLENFLFWVLLIALKEIREITITLRDLHFLIELDYILVEDLLDFNIEQYVFKWKDLKICKNPCVLGNSKNIFGIVPY